MNSCSSSSDQQPVNIADSIDVSYQTGPKISTHETLTIWIVNQTNYCISFPPGFGIRIFAETNNGWVEVQNTGKYLGSDPSLLKPQGDIFSQGIIDAQPDISQLAITKATNFYLEISGHLCDDDTVIVKKEIPFIVVP
jgi:hypothetical protein